MSYPMQPETNTKPPALTAWEYGPKGFGSKADCTAMILSMGLTAGWFEFFFLISRSRFSSIAMSLCALSCIICWSYFAKVIIVHKSSSVSGALLTCTATSTFCTATSVNCELGLVTGSAISDWESCGSRMGMRISLSRYSSTTKQFVPRRSALTMRSKRFSLFNVSAEYASCKGSIKNSVLPFSWLHKGRISRSGVYTPSPRSLPFTFISNL